MSVSSHANTPPIVDAEGSIEAGARTLASLHQDATKAPPLGLRSALGASATRQIERARRRLAATLPEVGALPKAAEWFLDNYYLVRRVARQVKEELPRDFKRHLPRLASGPAKGRPRIDALALELTSRKDSALDVSSLRRFVDAYQRVSPLSIAELWALPTMLRAAVLQQLVDSLGELQAVSAPPADEISGVERSIRTLRVLDVLDWRSFFEASSRVEAILRTDPSGVYVRMDFQTCDVYRKVVERIAWGAGRSEQEVAQLAIDLAREGDHEGRRGHVGFYLIAEGLRVLEERVGYQPDAIEAVRRTVTSHPTLFYLLPLAFLTFVPVAALTWLLLARGAHLLPVVAGAAAALIPVSAGSIAFLQLAFARLLPPRVLPKLDFKSGIPIENKTLVVMPTQLGRDEDVTSMLRQIELHYLSNPDPQLEFALLTDEVDKSVLHESSPASPLLEKASQGIRALNAKHATNRNAPFHLLHRDLRWNPRERRFMGWERKRGKLEELNKLLRGDETTSYSLHVGNPEGLSNVRYVITLDSDTQLPMGSAHRLVGLLAHPLNRAVFEDGQNRVRAGYTIIQPRIETSPSSAARTPFWRAFAGDVGFDIYTHACSELYQDLFGSGIYVGKGIYDVDGFVRSVTGSVPENTLVSHDLFEGIQGRAGLATDIVLFESYPASYVTYALRMHRWLRGDWQLVPWLFPIVPSADGGRVANTLTLADRWKILDNLRRSLLSPALLVLLVMGWTLLPGGAGIWTALAVTLLLLPSVPSLAAGGPNRLMSLRRCAFALAFLAYESVVAVDAVVRVWVRSTVTKRHLLEWTSAAHTAFRTEARSPRSTSWTTMMASPLLAVAIGAIVASVRVKSLWVAGPLLLVWLAAPEIASWASRMPVSSIEAISEDERRALRMLARRTWRFFDAFVGPGDQWLPIDNHQEAPHEQTAHRTSPTNIGLMLVSTLTAYDFGYIGPVELSVRLRRAFESIGRLTHYQGHLLNWYDTRSLQPLAPRYVSTVDSGNFAGCLLALKAGCEEIIHANLLRPEIWDGLVDSIDLLVEVVGPGPTQQAVSPRPTLARMRTAALFARDNPGESYPSLKKLNGEMSTALDRDLHAFLEAGALPQDPDLLRGLRTAIDRLHQQLLHMQQELDALAPWMALGEEAIAHGLTFPRSVRLDELASVSRSLRLALEARDPEPSSIPVSSTFVASRERLRAALLSAEASATELIAELRSLGTRADEEARGMDFKLLYDKERKLFRIGYNATTDQADAHHYDLLASEARLASYLAIVKRDVPESHWYALGRPMTQVDGAPALLSWGGTMFEYLMPSLLMKSQEGTLIAQTCALAVTAQMQYGKTRGEPWGVSESAYARVDADHTYQYRSFGVPGLGFKRGLEADQVVTPYASLLAVSLRPRSVVENVRSLEDAGMLGTYGLFEALDSTPARLPEPRSEQSRGAVVRSYMAHHQGMIFISLGNLLNGRSMVDRFHSDPLVETGEALLNERAPGTAPPEWPVAASTKLAGIDESTEALPIPNPWTTPEYLGPQAFVLSNGRLSSLLTGAGGGGLSWHGLALTRYEPDATRDDTAWLYLRDEETRHVWRATAAEGRTTFAVHRVDFHLRQEGISAHVNVAVAVADDVEMRQVTLHNETNRPRRLSVTSAGRPVLFDSKQAPTHPAFSSMFVISEGIVDLDALMFARRRQKLDEEPCVLVHRLVREGAGVTFAGLESDRSAFFGRPGNHDLPAALAAPGKGLHGKVGAVLDPIMSVMAHVDLPAKGTVTLAFVTSVARSRSSAVALAEKYGSMHSVRWALRDAEQDSPRRLKRARVSPELLPSIQRLFSAMLFSDSSLRAPADVRASTPACQERLWGRGISGDDPIVVVNVHAPEDPALQEVLAAQRFLRACGVAMDVVLIDEQPSGYATEVAGTLRNVLRQSDAMDWLNRHGGIFVIARDQAPASELRHLEVCARAILSTHDGSLASRLERPVDAGPALPRFEAILQGQPDERHRPRPKLIFDNGIGGFTEDGREYVLEVGPGAQAPAPWCNVLANPEFGCLVSESSFGASWSVNSGENRLTPWRNDPVFDTPSEALYLRDEETAALWSPTPLPAGREAHILVRHGAGYTTYERESHGLAQETTVFVPVDAPLKVIRLRLQNTSPRHRRLTVTYYAEWVLGSRRETQRPYIVSEVDRDRNCLLARCGWSGELGGRVAFLVSKEKMHGFTADRTEFLGRRGDYARPDALARWGLSGRTESVDPCGAIQVHLDLPPGAEIETHFVLGQASDRQGALQLAEHFRDGAVVEAAWVALRAYWEDILGSVQVKTPEPSMDIMLNRWLLYQTLSARVFGRTGFYQSSGAFGYRDQLQDVLALLHAAPGIARAHILEAAKHQFEEGDVLHWWHPPSGRGVRTRCSDDMVWLPFATAEYVAATGDVAILDVPVPFLDGPPLKAEEHDRYAHYETSAISMPLLEHCRRALERALTAGSHGLPLMGDGDWNDGMNRVGAEGRGESVWLAWFLCATMDRLATLLRRKEDFAAARTWTARADALRATTSEVAWDGGWYLRAFHDDGSLIGSATSRECRIDSIAQSWAALSKGDRNVERLRTAVRAADAELVLERKRLVLLFWPPYDSTVHDPGYVRAYPPGVRENGGQYTHAATWLGLAHAALGDGSAAERVFRMLNPILRVRTAENADLYRVEPYALAGDVYSCDPWVGRGGWTWYTGAAAWTWRLGIEAILGIRSEAGELVIDPCIPPHWPGFEAWVRRGKRRIHIVVENALTRTATGTPTITLDGTAVESNRMPLDPDTDGTHEVVVRLEAGRRPEVTTQLSDGVRP